MKHKSEVLKKYKAFEAWVANHRNSTKIKTLQSDHGSKYMSMEFTTYLQSCRTTHQLMVHDTPSQNGISKQCNQTILERTCALLINSELPKTLWAEAAMHVVWLMN